MFFEMMQNHELRPLVVVYGTDLPQLPAFEEEDPRRLRCIDVCIIHSRGSLSVLPSFRVRSTTSNST